MTLPIILAAVLTSSGGVTLDYDTRLPAPEATPPDDLCRVAVPLPDLTCFDRGDCSPLEETLAVTAACYRRKWRMADAEAKGCREELSAESSRPGPEVYTAELSDPGLPLWEVILVVAGVAVLAGGTGYLLGSAR